VSSYKQPDFDFMEPEEKEPPYVEFKISVSPSDPTLRDLSRQIDDKDIIIPFYQRKYVWTIEQASKLIESFLMGLPVPQIFLYVNDKEELEVIDGQQRILSINYFINGFFKGSDTESKGIPFKLKGLSEYSEYNGKSYDELSLKSQRKLNNSTLRSINIKQLSPTDNKDSVFYIFERLNTGGTPLKAQEIRNAVFRGEIVNKLGDLNAFKAWRTLLGYDEPVKHQSDMELILRLFSLFGDGWKHYTPPMISFLNESMRANKDFDSKRALEFIKKFKEVSEFVISALDRPFRPHGRLNTAALEAIMLVLLNHKPLDQILFKKRYAKLMRDKKFPISESTSSSSKKSLVARITRAEETLINGEE